MTPTQLIPRMTRPQVTLYQRMKSIQEEESRLNARAKVLSKEREQLREKLLEVFGDREELRLSSRKILMRKEIEYKPVVINREAYTVIKFDEVEG